MKKILVIDDDVLLRKILIMFLTAHEYKVITAENGALGWQLIQQENPDLIICDLMMPELDGIEILTKLRRNSDVSNIPFIVISGNKDEASQELVLELGSNYYLTKPFTPEKLLKVISQHLTNEI
ncbi:MAG: response regulator [Xenococcaceae cyanobacterium]